jgi:membrane fusion protein, multidrug efflux system
MKQELASRKADIPVCRFGRLSSRPSEPRTGKSGKPAGSKACPAVFLVASAILAAAWLPGCNRAPTAPARPVAPVVSVRVIHASRGPVSRSVSLPATMRANQQVMLYAKVSGYLKTIRVDRGDHVQAGELLAEVEAPELIADQARFRAEVELTRTDYQRLGEAQKKAPDLVVPLTVDTAKSKHEMALANLKRNQTLLDYTKIVAPFSGVITKRWVDPGALIPAATASSAPQSAAVVTLMDFSVVRIELAVPWPEAPLVKTGQVAEVVVEELAGRVFRGSVSRYAYALEEVAKSLPVEIDLPNPDEALRPGMFATVRLVLQQKPEVLRLPAQAIVVEKNRASVFTFTDGKARKRPIQVGFDDGQWVEIVGGLTADEAVIVAGKLPLADGQPVQLTEEK